MREMAAAPLVALLLSAPASADWQFTKWGMTEKQVVAASGRLATPADSSVGDCAVIPGSGKAKLHMPYRSGSLTFDAVFCFDRLGRLSTVDLRTSGNQDIDITAALRSKYGKPISDEEDDTATFVEWVSGKDTIRYARFLDEVNVVYVPRGGGNASGL